MASRQCMSAMELEEIEREKFDGLLAKCQICQSFMSVNCAIQYIMGLILEGVVLKHNRQY